MGLFNILGGGDDSNAQPQLIDPRQAGLLGFLAGMQKSGALDYTAPFLSGKVPSGFAAGLAGGAGGMLAGQQAALNMAKTQAETGLLGINTQKGKLELQYLPAQIQAQLGLLQAAGEAPPPMFGGSPGAAIAGVQPQSTSAPQMGGGAADLTQPGEGEDPRGLVPYIRLTATKYGIDPDTAVAVARSEGLKTFLGDGGKSGGAFQLYTGGGLGNTFEKETGLNPLDPKNERATIDFALQQAAQGGWGPWHGAAKIGIHGFDGIGRFAPPQDNSMLADSGAPSFNTGPVTGLGQTPAAPIRLAQNGPLPAGLLTPSGGSAPLVRKNSIGETYISTDGGRDWQLAGPAASPNVAGGTRGAGDAPNGIDKTSGPVTPPIAPAAPQGLLAQAGPQAAPAPPGGLLGAQPPQMPQPTPAATPPGGQQINPAYIQWAQRQARIYAALGRPVPPEIAAASQLPLVGPKAGLEAAAQLPYKITAAKPGTTVLQGTTPFYSAPTLQQTVGPNGNKQFTYMTPQGAIPTGQTAALGPGQTAGAEETARIAAQNTPPATGGQAGAPAAESKVDLGGSPIAKGLVSS
ncbi:MAG TPA: hypothetical protein VF113_04755, partial [Stellaceae bacterium]